MNINKFSIKKIILSVLIILVMLVLLLKPDRYIQSFLNGVKVWAICVLPALFPFIILTKLLSSLNIFEFRNKFFKLTARKLFNLDSNFFLVFFMSIISGYPIGSKLISELYEKGFLTKHEAMRMSTIASTSGPMFLLGTIGTGLIKNKFFGILILLVHIISAILNGLLYRNIGKNSPNTLPTTLNTANSTENTLSSHIDSSISSILMIGGFICLSFVLVDILNDFYVIDFFTKIINSFLAFFNLSSPFTKSFLGGLIETTRGVLDITNISKSKEILPLITFLVNFSGLSILLQSITYLQKCKIKSSFIFLTKLTHALIGFVIMKIIILFI